MTTEHAVPLDQVPTGLVVPSELEARFGYDPARRCLWFQGFMSKATFDRLSGLCDDWDFRSALERLFLEAVPEAESKPPRAVPPGRKRWFGLL